MKKLEMSWILGFVMLMSFVLGSLADVQRGNRTVRLELNCQKELWSGSSSYYVQTCQMFINVTDMGQNEFTFENATFLRSMNFPEIIYTKGCFLDETIHWVTRSKDIYTSYLDTINHINTTTSMTGDFVNYVNCSRVNVKASDGKVEKIGDDCFYESSITPSRCNQESFTQVWEFELSLKRLTFDMIFRDTKTQTKFYGTSTETEGCGSIDNFSKYLSFKTYLNCNEIMPH